MALNSNTMAVNEVVAAPVTTIGGVEVSTTSNPPTHFGLGPTPDMMALSKIFRVPRRLTTVATPATTGSLAVFTTWSAIVPISNILNQYYQFRGNTNIVVNYSGNPNCQGMVRIYAVPSRSATDFYTGSDAGFNLGSSGTPAGNLCRSSQFPHLDLDLSKACTAELKLPYSAPSTYRPVASYVDWTLYYGPIVTQTMVNNTTPDAIVYDIHAYYTDVELTVLQPQGAEDEAPKGALSRGLAYASAVAAAVPIPIFSPISLVLGGLSGIASFFGFSRFPVEPTEAIVTRSVMNMAVCGDQPNFSFHLGTSPFVQHDVSGMLIPMSKPGDTNFRQIASMRADCVLLAAGAGFNAGPDSYVVRTDGWFEFTPLTFVSAVFESWCGDLIYTFTFHSSPLIRSRVGIVIVPPLSALPTSYPADGSYLTTIVEVSGTTSVDVTVPYLYADPMTQFILRSGLSVTTASQRILWFLIAGPVGSDPSPPSPVCVLSVRAGPTFELAKPSLAQINNYKLVTQGKMDESGPPITLKNSLWAYGEMLHDMRQLCKRSCLVSITHTVNLADDTLNAVTWPVAGTLPFTTATFTSATKTVSIELNAWSYAKYFATAYMGWTGGHTWIASSNAGGTSPTMVSQVFCKPGINFLDNNTPKYAAGGTGEQLYAGSLSMEVTLPYRSWWNFNVPTSYINTTSPQNVECLSIAAVYPESTTADTTLWHSGADDYNFAGFLAAPAFEAI